MNYKIVDNFLQKNDFDTIKNYIMGNNFPWYYIDEVSKKDVKDGFYFSHTFFKKVSYSEESKILFPILNILNPKSIIKIKANMYLKTSKIHEHGKHKDCEFNHNGFLFYLNTNDGFTRLKNGIKINSIENRGLYFDAGEEHNSSTCTNMDRRLNINFNYF